MKRAAIAAALAAFALSAGAAAGHEASDPTQRIVGGEVAPAGAYPFMAGLISARDDPEFGRFCGGTLIGPATVLTAAHCVVGLLPSEFDVVVGRQRLSSDAGRRLEVSRYAARPGRADVAQVRLAEPVTEPPIALATAEDASLFSPGMPATALGWGATRESSGAGSDDLRQVEVPIVSDEVCDEAYRDEGGLFRAATFICAGAGGRDSCAGDSGGPLIVSDSAGALRQVGVTSFGRGCGRARFPGAYAEVPAVLGFLTDPDPVFAPVPNRARAEVRGKPKVGHRLRCAAGRWSGEDVELSYVWPARYGRGRPLSRDRTFVPGPGMPGERVNCIVFGENDGGIIQLLSRFVRIRGREG